MATRTGSDTEHEFRLRAELSVISKELVRAVNELAKIREELSKMNSNLSSN